MQELERMISFYHTANLFFLILAFAFLGITVLLFFRFHIRQIFDMKTGRGERRSIRKMEELNAKTGKLREDPMMEFSAAPGAAAGQTGRIAADSRMTGQAAPIPAGSALTGQQEQLPAGAGDIPARETEQLLTGRDGSASREGAEPAGAASAQEAEQLLSGRNGSASREGAEQAADDRARLLAEEKPEPPGPFSVVKRLMWIGSDEIGGI